MSIEYISLEEFQRTYKATTKPRIDKADTLAAQLATHAPDLAALLEREFHFHPDRRWRFDFAAVHALVAVEVDGGQYKPGGGRHGTDKDREKLNQAAVLGWRVLHFSPRQVERDPLGCIALIRQAIAYQKAR